ncbi:MAG: formylglycine-generating enzyme family protein [Deltaproteobacteria bacterium]|nr:MAG: formylglycine-generating enzyme family protein [Deltaproteobacteria bacterium]
MRRTVILSSLLAILVFAWTLNCGDDGGTPACIDNDGDTYGQNCSAGPDCDDSDVDNWESCETCLDSDSDTYYAGCDAYNSRPGPDECDDDANNWTAAGCVNCADADGDGYRGTDCDLDEDCDDGDFLIYPDAPEICDGIDNQCPGDAGYGTVDEGFGTPCGSMVLIPSGCFDMGDHFGEGCGCELPVHNVCITSSFYMDIHEVTNAEYKACVDDEGCSAPLDSGSWTRTSYYGNPTYDNYPVIYVDWNRATAYCSWAGKRLPTEAEWEYAARGGLVGKRYPWGDTISGSDANYWNSGDPEDNDTTPVEYYPANGYGLYDMVGNVYELVNDWFQIDYYSVSPTNDPPGPASGSGRVTRGGSWAYNPDGVRVSVRGIELSGDRNEYGFRCVASGE